MNQFLAEAKTVARFQGHTCIVSVLSFFEENGTGYMVMPYIEGVTLIQYLKQQSDNRIPYQQALNILMPIMDALREVHADGVLHRDISPDNIYITTKGQVKLLDFGAARFALGEHSQSITSMVKPGYSPEEQYRSRGTFGPYSDIYALAATFYRCLTGAIPYSATDRMMGEDIDWPCEQGIDLPEHAELALKQAMALKGVDRFQEVNDFQQALNPVVSVAQPQVVADVPTAPKAVDISDDRPKLAIYPFSTPLLITGALSLFYFLFFEMTGFDSYLNSNKGWLILLTPVFGSWLPIKMATYFVVDFDVANYKKLRKRVKLLTIVLSVVLGFFALMFIAVNMPNLFEDMPNQLGFPFMLLLYSLCSYPIYAFFLKRLQKLGRNKA